MVKARLRHDWALAANVQATVVNALRAKGTPAKEPREFMPRELREKRPELSPSEFMQRWNRG